MRSAAVSPEGVFEVLGILGLDAVFESPAFVASLDDVTVMGETVK
jgi:hypothetical protein